MKKLLVIPLLLAHYALVLIPFPFMIVLIFVRASAEWLHDIADQIYCYLDERIANPVGRINRYSLAIMKSDKTIKWINEASKRLKQGKPIDKEG